MKKPGKAQCCNHPTPNADHPDHSKELNRVSRIAGQVEGVRRMITERAYCPDIITQIQATRAALQSLEAALLEKHLSHCVQEALLSQDRKKAEQKLAELVQLFRKS